MKIALIRRRFSATGGAELYTQRLMTALQEAGHELHLYAETWEGAAPGVTLHSIPVHGSRAVRPLRFAEAVEASLANTKFDCIFSLERTVSQDVYRAGDGVHRVWLERRRAAAPWWKKPFVGRGAFHRNMLRLEGMTFDPVRTRHIIVNSDMVRREIMQCFGFPPGRIHLVRNGVETARFQGVDRTAARERYRLASNDFVLLFVGSGWERKGLRTLTNEILPRLERSLGRPVRLLVVGKGNSSGLRRANVVFAGPEREVQWAYAAADLFVFLPLYEPSANVCIEALAAGLPVITNRQNGASEIIQEGVTGTVLSNPNDIAGALAGIRYWADRPRKSDLITPADISLARNVAETVKILTLAATEKGQGTSHP